MKEEKIFPNRNGVYPKINTGMSEETILVDFGITNLHDVPVTLKRNKDALLVKVSTTHDFPVMIFRYGEVVNGDFIVKTIGYEHRELANNLADFVNSQTNELDNTYVQYGTYMESSIKALRLLTVSQDIDNTKLLRTKELIENGLSDIFVEYKEKGIPSFGRLMNIVCTSNGFSVVVRSDVTHSDIVLDSDEVKIDEESLAEAENKAIQKNEEMVSRIQASTPSNY